VERSRRGSWGGRKRLRRESSQGFGASHSGLTWNGFCQALRRPHRVRATTVRRRDEHAQRSLRPRERETHIRAHTRTYTETHAFFSAFRPQSVAHACSLACSRPSLPHQHAPTQASSTAQAPQHTLTQACTPATTHTRHSTSQAIFSTNSSKRPHEPGKPHSPPVRRAGRAAIHLGRRRRAAITLVLWGETSTRELGERMQTGAGHGGGL